MSVRLLTKHQLEFLSLKGDYPGSSESTLVKMSHCWKSHVMAHFIIYIEKGKQQRLRPREPALLAVSWQPNLLHGKKMNLNTSTIINQYQRDILDSTKFFTFKNNDEAS